MCLASHLRWIQPTRRPQLSTSPDLAYLGQYRGAPGLDLGRRYSKAPIAQSILDLHVDSNADLDTLGGLNFGAGYQASNMIYTPSNSTIENDDGMPEATGYAYRREDTGRTIHATSDEFSFIWSDAYTCWEDFIAEAEAAWLSYKHDAVPVAVSRIGVRFVNQIPLPEKPIEIKDYLRTSVDISSYLPQQVAGMFFQVQVPLHALLDGELDVTATITSALLPQDEDHPGGGLLLDIDVVANVAMSTQSVGFDDSLRGTLDKLRLAKNYVFEACITDATRGMIDDGS